MEYWKEKIVELKNFNQALKIDSIDFKDKIIFFNEPMDARFINTFRAYGACSNQRYSGASIAGELGAKAALVRSLASSRDSYPHTGSMQYKEGVNRVPGAAIGTEDAYRLSLLLKENKLNASLELNCHKKPDTLAYNVISEIKGSEFPDKIILIGGHIDSWDVGEGAHDDGAGIIQSLEVLRLFKELGNSTKAYHSLRLVYK